MPIELGIWRIDHELTRIQTSAMDEEARLEDLLDQDITIASPDWMIIGRQVPTGYGSYIDLLAMDRDGNLIVIELKRDKTPRDVVAQALDYASWIKDLEDDDVASIYEAYVRRYHSDKADRSLDDAFRERFGAAEMPETLNEAHELVVVASALDESTERIVSYLTDEHGVPINALFFQVFRDGDREYLTRTWFIDPSGVTTISGETPVRVRGEWNGEYYVCFGESPHRRWTDAVKYGFISAGGRQWYSKALGQLEEGARVWVNVPGKGYVGVGIVTGPVVKVDQFTVKRQDGSEASITEMPVDAPEMFARMDNVEETEYLVRVEWTKTVPLDEALKEKGFFGNQNVVCKPTVKKWTHTIERLKKRFGVE